MKKKTVVILQGDASVHIARIFKSIVHLDGNTYSYRFPYLVFT